MHRYPFCNNWIIAYRRVRAVSESSSNWGGFERSRMGIGSLGPWDFRTLGLPWDLWIYLFMSHSESHEVAMVWKYRGSGPFWPWILNLTRTRAWQYIGRYSYIRIPLHCIISFIIIILKTWWLMSVVIVVSFQLLNIRKHKSRYNDIVAVKLFLSFFILGWHTAGVVTQIFVTGDHNFRNIIVPFW